MDPALKSLTAIGYLGPYASTDVIDPYTVKVNFKDPYAPFLNNLTHSVLAPVSPVAGKNYDAFAAHPVGTGPFMFKEYKAQVSMTFVRNPDYKWGPSLMRNTGAPYLDQVTYRFIPAGELTTQLGLLQNGEVQMSNGVAPQELTNLQKDAKFQTLLPLVPGSPQIFPLNLLKPPTDDLKVRQALFYALDTPAIVDTLWFGGRKAARGPLSSPTLDYNPAVESTYGYDPKKAGALLDEAGWKMGSDGIRVKNGQRLKVLTIISVGIEGKNAELAQAYFKAVGIDNQVDEQEYAQTATRFLAGEHNIARVYFSHTDPVVLTTLYHSKNIQGTNFNRTMKPDPKLDAMLDAAQADLNAETRKQKYFDIQMYILDNALAIPRWEERVFWVAKANIKGLHFQPLGGPWLQDVWIAAQ
jgi:peptide/nickel transport system substrate-binding protein